MLRFLTSGESHGRGLVLIVEGMPSGVPFTSHVAVKELARRRLGYGRGPRMALETDSVTLIGGVRHGRTLGSPVSVMIENAEFEAKWSEEMSPEAGRASSVLTKPRPGHADLAGMLKYDFDDARNVLERASARGTAARVIVGVLAKQLLREVGVEIVSHVVSIGDVNADSAGLAVEDFVGVDENPMRCIDGSATSKMQEVVDRAREAGDTVGGSFEVLAFGVPAGIGSYVHWDRRLDAALAGAIVSINAVKAAEIGEATRQSTESGRQAHDEILAEASGGGTRIVRKSNKAGGIEGGMSTGEPIVVRGAMKPLASISPGLLTIDMETGEPAKALTQRTDSCAVPAAAIVGEAMVAYVLASEMLRKLGGDSLEQFKEAAEAWQRRLVARQRKA